MTPKEDAPPCLVKEYRLLQKLISFEEERAADDSQWDDPDVSPELHSNAAYDVPVAQLRELRDKLGSLLERTNMHSVWDKLRKKALETKRFPHPIDEVPLFVWRWGIAEALNIANAEPDKSAAEQREQYSRMRSAILTLVREASKSSTGMELLQSGILDAVRGRYVAFRNLAGGSSDLGEGDPLISGIDDAREARAHLEGLDASIGWKKISTLKRMSYWTSALDDLLMVEILAALQRRLQQAIDAPPVVPYRSKDESWKKTLVAIHLSTTVEDNFGAPLNGEVVALVIASMNLEDNEFSEKALQRLRAKYVKGPNAPSSV